MTPEQHAGCEAFVAGGTENSRARAGPNAWSPKETYGVDEFPGAHAHTVVRLPGTHQLSARLAATTETTRRTAKARGERCKVQYDTRQRTPETTIGGRCTMEVGR